MTRSESIAALAAALVEAQGKIENASKNATNPHFKNKYADLAEVLNTVRPVLAEHGLAVLQNPSFSEGVVSVETVLLHKSGEFVSSVISAPVSKSDAQGVGSAITYCRRYALAAVCGIAQEDDDGNGATGVGTHNEKKVDVDSLIVDRINNAANVEELTKIWNSIDVGLRHAYQPFLAARKAQVSK